jgi:nicotinate-nucleotide adenylyltransferase
LKTKRIAIFGGSFNPVHNAHVKVASYVAEHENVDEVWVMLTPQNPFKKDQSLLPDDIRLSLLKESFKDIPNVVVSDFEFELPKPSFTFNTLEKLKEAYPNYIFSLVFGIDILAHLLEWQNAVHIVEKHQLLAYLRPGYEQSLDSILQKLEIGYNEKKSVNAPTLLQQLKIINGPLEDVSSTEIWEKVKRKEEIAHLVPSPVAKFLKQKYY